MKYCEECGTQVADNARICPRCGYVFSSRNACSKEACLLLCIFIWPLGLHRFMCGDTGTGIAILVGNFFAWTIGWLIFAPLWLCPLAWLIDIVSLCRDRRPIWK